MNIVKTALELVSSENRGSKSISGGRQVLSDSSSNVRDDNNSTSTRNEQSGTGMELLAHTAATRSAKYPSAQQPWLTNQQSQHHPLIDPSTSTVSESTPSSSYTHYPSPQHQQFRRDAPNLLLNTSPTSTIQHQSQSSISQTDSQTLSSPSESTLMNRSNLRQLLPKVPLLTTKTRSKPDVLHYYEITALVEYKPQGYDEWGEIGDVDTIPILDTCSLLRKERILVRNAKFVVPWGWRSTV
ncbi:11675_t:CDS:2 [Paraglomus brasilianum]|uniref:11675_t:CDS:1 n=1 Tax=Paraglomus brasilianum TaxID=144538 RepID=A0A9N8W098_9GLOM|nr:11675_t:CDS:2 [Paraglomus brasilianum]